MSTTTDDFSALQERLSYLEQSLYGKLTPTPTAPTPLTAAPARQLANPSPLGLLGFAIASLVSAVLKLSPDASAALDGTFAATAFFLGGAAQLLAALFQLLLNHTHAATAFAVYGLHWMSMGVTALVSSLADTSFLSTPRPASAAAYNLAFALATAVLWVPTFRMNAVLNATFVALFFVFTLDVPAAYGVRAASIASGVWQCVAAALGFYAAALDLVNETWRRPVLPLFPHKEHRDDYDQGTGLLYVPKPTHHKSVLSSIHL